VVPGRLGAQRAAEPARLNRSAILAAALGVALVAAACGGGSTQAERHHGGSTTTTTPSTTGTSAGGPPLTVGIICTTPTDAAQAFVAGWVAGDRAAASRCGSPDAVTTIFAHGTNAAAWAFQGCGGPDPGVPVCTFTYPGGTAQLTLMGTEAQGWKVSSTSLGGA